MFYSKNSHRRLIISILFILCCATGIRPLAAQNDTTAMNATFTLKPSNITKDGATLRGQLLDPDTSIYEVGFVYLLNNEQHYVLGIKDVTSDNFYGSLTGLPNNTEIRVCTYAKRRSAPITYGNVIIFTTGSKVDDGITLNINTSTPKVENIKINTHVSRHRTSFGSTLAGFLNLSNLTGEKRRLINACDYRSGTVRGKALEIASQSPGTFNLSQICDIFDYCNSNWKYVNDPTAREIYQKASFTIVNKLSGDCDDFAILVCSMLLSIGGDARINFAFQKSNSGGHAFTEINLGKADMNKVADYIRYRYKDTWTGNIHYRIDRQQNCWLNMDWWAKHPGGRYYQADRGTRFYILDDYCEDF